MTTPLSYSPAPSNPGRPSGPVIRALVLIGIIAALISILLPILNAYRQASFERAARRCPTNLRQIGLAIQMYANDNHGQPPADMASLLAADDISSEALVCPFTHDTPAAGKTAAEIRASLARPGHNSYVFTPLAGDFRTLTAEHVVAYDNPANHGGTVDALFGDGHTEWLDATRTAHLLAELNAGHNPPRPVGTGGGP